ncbi:hypothetical protein BBJ29_001922 [Phytophthora kernoviae]|uniref:Mei2-like C-terminal RNA recognition motif domain-containing protein n=1 Tax=Phytophthora kernoviae TaxID=325452 RepID=A0A3F2RVB0_9STRA|nr:hypothetical protein BBJ29_001922 [Phytophthora kernoviae]RLN64968.1 hypothetical protein BBP00_00003121 [Phytophthora kernoviae]
MRETRELWENLRTDFVSRHVIIRHVAGAWDPLDVQRLLDGLNNFGSVASSRRELASSGLLFCTFFELSSAVAAVEHWCLDTDIISFCLPYELPDDVNSATLLIRFALGGPHVTAAELRLVCAHFGQVASVLQPDVQVAKYIVEYSDSRALPGALNGLPHAFHTSVSASVARTTPPTLDVSKLKLFHDCLDRAVAMHPRTARTRHKSFSSSTQGGALGRVMTGRNDQGTGEFSLSIERVASGEDMRTTLMIRNIPNKYTQQMLLAEINRNHRGNYDFFYLPIDFKNKCNMGYAFINFIEAAHIEAFHREFDGQKWTNFNSEKYNTLKK